MKKRFVFYDNFPTRAAAEDTVDMLESKECTARKRYDVKQMPRPWVVEVTDDCEYL